MNYLPTTPITDYLLNLTYMTIFMCLCMLILKWFKARNTAKAIASAKANAKDVLTNESVGHTIYELFPEWQKEFENDPTMCEIEATCDLYLAAKDLLTRDPMDDSVDVNTNLENAVKRFEKHTLCQPQL
jgi:hypothetical protein